MGNRSGRRLSNAVKKENRKKRQKIGKKRPKYQNHPIPQGYFETYSVLKEHITDFLRERKKFERWATLVSKDQITRSVIVLLGHRAILNVSKIGFRGDNVSVVVSIHTKETSAFDRIRMHSTRNCHHRENTWALGDPNLFEELDVLLTWAYEQYATYEYPDGIDT